MATEFTDDPVHAAIPERSNDTTSLDQSPDNATQDLYRAALGTGRVDAYCKLFARFDAADRAGLSWNWAAALLTLNWMAFRQMWGPALAYVGSLVAALLLLLGIARLLFDFSPEVEGLFLAGIALLSIVIPGLYGNSLLYAQCRRRMQNALATHATIPEACAMLSRQSSGRQRLFWLALANVLFVATASAVAVALPDVGNLPLHTDKMELARNAASGTLTGASQASASAPAVGESAASSAPSSSPTLAASTAPSVALAAAPASAAEPMVPATQPGASRVVQGKIQNEAQTTSPMPAAPLPEPATLNKPVQAEPRTPSASAALNSQTNPQLPAVKPIPTVQPKPQKTPAPAQEQTQAPKPAAKTKPAAAASKSDAHSPTFMINVGLFADDNNARNAAAKLNDAGLTALQQVLHTSKGKRTRVRTGPYDTQAEADAAADKIHGLGLDAIVFQQP